jgi:FAD/FMN-containing dehydrogenase
LIEATGTGGAHDAEAFESALESAHEQGLVEDAVLARSSVEAQALWKIRDSPLEAFRDLGPYQSFDISLGLDAMERFAGEVVRRIDARWPGSITVLFGHLGDGNLHVLTTAGRAGREIDRLVYELTGELGGSISAEHGIGRARRPYLGLSRSPAEIALMRDLKRTLDPHGILNPGRVV